MSVLTRAHNLRSSFYANNLKMWYECAVFVMLQWMCFNLWGLIKNAIYYLETRALTALFTREPKA